MKYGIRNGCLKGTWEEAFALAGRLGFDSLEVDVGRDYTETPLWSLAGRDQVSTWAQRAGVELASVCIGALWTHSFADADAQVRQRAREVALNTIEACGQLGAKWILLPVTPGAEVEPEEGVARWIEGVGACVEAAAEHQVVLALENVGRGYAQQAEGLLAIAQGVDSPWVRTYYDFGNGLSLGNDPLAEMELLGREWIAILHAKDPGGQLLGEGQIDFAAVAAVVQALDYDGYIVLETPPTDDPAGAARHNLDFMRRVFGR